MIQILSTAIEKHFRLMPSGLYREFTFFFTHHLDDNHNIISTEINKIVAGKFYQKISFSSSGIFGGDVLYCEPHSKDTIKLSPLIKKNEVNGSFSSQYFPNYKNK